MVKLEKKAKVFTPIAGIFLLMLMLIAPALSLGSADNSTLTAGNSEAGVFIKKYPDNYTCFLIESPTGVRIITDPYQMNEDVRADIVTESHQHYDHNDVSRIIKPYQLITTIGESNIKGIKITGIAGKHNKNEEKYLGNVGVTNIIFVFEIAGIKIAQFASQGVMQDTAALMKIGQPDILIIQIGDSENQKLTIGDVLTIIQKLKAKIIIPAHCFYPQEDSQILAKLLTNSVVTYVTNGQLMITKEDLQGINSPKIMVLDN